MQSGKTISTLITILFMMTCAAATIDTQMFVYPSLSRSLLMEGGLLMLAFVALLHFLFCGRRMCINKFHVFLFLWITYIIIHSRLSPVAEVYRVTYLCVTLFSIIPLSYCLRTRLITPRKLCYGLLMIGTAHVVCTLAQWVGLMTPENTLYPITGCSDNPTVSALYLAGCLPLYRFIGSKHLRWAFLGAALLCILLLRCRTAYIGVCVEGALFFLFRFFSSHSWNKNHHYGFIGFKGFISLAFVFVLVFVSVTKMYQMKRDSADGRMLIWRLSATMIVDKPMGHGYGLFAKHYNQRQAEYFSADGGTETERCTATYTAMAYNDYLEHGVDGGIIAMMFLAGFYILTITKTKTKMKAEAAILSAFAVMSLTNFVCATIQPWLLIICTAAMALSQDKSTEPPRKALSIAISVAMLVLTTIFSVMIFSMTKSQLQLHNMAERMKSGETLNDKEFADIEQGIYTSEAYWRTRARNLMHNDSCHDAMQCIGKAMQLTSSPLLCYMMHQCTVAQGKEYYGIPYISEVCNIQPKLLLPKLILMRYHDSRTETGKALHCADEIISADVKVNNKKTAAIIREAEEYRRKYGNQ